MKVTLLMAMSVDGRIAKDSDHFPDWTAKGDKQLFLETTKRAGVMVMGRKTFDTLPGALPGRQHVVMTRNAELQSESDLVTYTQETPQAIYNQLKAAGHEEIILCGGTQINTLWARAGLIDRCIVTVSPLVMGGGLGVFGDGVTLDLRLETLEQRDQLVVLHYSVLK